MSSLTLQFFCKLGAAGESNMSAMAKVSEELALVERFRRGDDSAFDRIVEQYAAELAALANRLLGWPGDVDNVVQEVFVVVWAGVKMYAPPQQSRQDLDPYRVRDTDSPEIAAWRTRMAGEKAKAVYMERASTSEPVNADLRTHRGLGPFLVRGLRKVRCVVLWPAPAYNLMHFGKVSLTD